VLEHLSESLLLSTSWHRVLYIGQCVIPGSVDHLGSRLFSFLGLIGVASSHLGWQVIHVGVVIALSASVCLSTLHGSKPIFNCRKFVLDVVAFVVVKTGCHPFNVGSKDHVHYPKLFQEVRTTGDLKGI